MFSTNTATDCLQVIIGESLIAPIAMKKDQFNATLEQFRTSSNADHRAFAGVILDDQGIDSGKRLLPSVTHFDHRLHHLGELARNEFSINPTARQAALIALHGMAAGESSHPFVQGFVRDLIGLSGCLQNRFLTELVLSLEPAAIAPQLVSHSRKLSFGWQSKPSALSSTEELSVTRILGPITDPLESYFLQLDTPLLCSLLTPDPQTDSCRAPDLMVGACASLRPEALPTWITSAKNSPSGKASAWENILSATRQWDADFLEAASYLDSGKRFELLLSMFRAGRLADSHLLREEALATGQQNQALALTFLFTDFRPDFLPHFLHLAGTYGLHGQRSFEKPLAQAASNWMAVGEPLFNALLALRFENAKAHGISAGRFTHTFLQALTGLLDPQSEAPEAYIADWFEKALQLIQSRTIPASDRTSAALDFWEIAGLSSKGRLLEALFSGLGSSAKGVRRWAIRGLLYHPGEILTSRALALLAHGKIDGRFGAAELLLAHKSPSAVPGLLHAAKNDDSLKLRSFLQEVLKNYGVQLPPPPLEELEIQYSTLSGRIKAPSPPWLDRSSLPPLISTSGRSLSNNAIDFLFYSQDAANGISQSPAIGPLLDHIDPSSSAPFAMKLMEGFISSDQEISDRWVFSVAGLLGDDRLIPTLLGQIQAWHYRQRFKLAEYAIQAISLLPGNAPLTTLDGLAKRYQIRGRSIGKASLAAFQMAASVRGLSPDELGDMIVPALEFDVDGRRRFTWQEGEIDAVLGNDFQVTWEDPGDQHSWKTVPAHIPDALKQEAAALIKELKAVTKAQPRRIELSLIRQRRWIPERWRELYGNHPVLRHFSGSLIWGIYEESGKLLRTFRRYPQGLLADAAGNLEEIPDSNTLIGLVHPIDLDPHSIKEWKAHFTRFRIKPPFPQIGRPIHLPDPLHANRRAIQLTSGQEMLAGAFRARCEKRGWVRGPVTSRGMVSSYRKSYPDLEITVILPVDGLFAGSLPKQTVSTQSAFFIAMKEGADRSSDPLPDDPRVLRFDAIPPVVWSETIADLKAIIGA